jgi:hypothetical protein
LERGGHRAVAPRTCAIGLIALILAFALGGCETTSVDSFDAYELYATAAAALHNSEGRAMDMDIVYYELSGERLEGVSGMVAISSHYEVSELNSGDVEMKAVQKGKTEKYMDANIYYRNGQLFMDDIAGKQKFATPYEAADEIHDVPIFPEEAVRDVESESKFGGGHEISFSVENFAIQECRDVSYLYNQKYFMFSEGTADVIATIGKNGELKEFEIAVTLFFSNRSNVVVTFKVYNIVTGIVQIDFPSDLEEYTAITIQTGVEEYYEYEAVS